MHGNLGREGAYGTDAAMLRDRVTAAIGDHYLVGREVGRGGMAVVYAAEDVRLQRKVALKVLPPDLAFRPDVRERFVREAQMAARLNHPHIVPIYAVHEVPGLVCFAMALVEGESLAARILREPRLPFSFVASMLEQMADALAYAHACGVVHRDMKPDNVLLDRESGRALVTDFGIARAAESGSRLTQTGIAVGTPAFMSPEQAMGDKEVDGRSDVYAVGVIGYLMLAGRLPFEAPTTPAMLMKHVSDTPPPLHSLRPAIPRVLVDILERCLAKKPADRWESALQLRDTLRRVQRDGSLSAPMPAAIAPLAAPLPMPAPPPRPWDPDRDERVGNRAEDWAPRRVVEPSPAPRQAPAPGALPPMPQLPPLPIGADRSTRREWKKANREAVKQWRKSVKLQRKQVNEAYLAELKAHEVAVRMAGGAASTPAVVADRVMRFRTSLKWLGGSSALGIGSLIVGVSLNEEVFIAPMLAGLVVGLGSLAVAGRRALRLRRLGISPLAALGEAWRTAPAARDNRAHHVRLAELVDKTAGGVVAQSAYGDLVRNACDDRLVIAEILSKLSPEDQALMPDIDPTADALLERIGALANGLERLDRDLPGGALADLAARIAAVEAEPLTSPDRERRLTLLMRQRASLDDLQSRRETMRRQIDSASLALRSLRLDIVKLRTMGLHASMDDVTSATQEARAVSRELGYVLEAAEESRRL
ncbi:serine/threonine-protein kinase [Gemmatimonas sp.]|uniref:serine/threonine-protein kinase n=1 Tax=Gemmatimonas sp. TaxID=1962908 RepID=UPI0037BFC3C7